MILPAVRSRFLKSSAVPTKITFPSRRETSPLARKIELSATSKLTLGNDAVTVPWTATLCRMARPVPRLSNCRTSRKSLSTRCSDSRLSPSLVTCVAVLLLVAGVDCEAAAPRAGEGKEPAEGDGDKGVLTVGAGGTSGGGGA